MFTETVEAAPARLCPNCGAPVVGRGRGPIKKFCSTECTTSFNNRTKSEGSVLVAPLKAWMKNRHAKPGTREAAVCRAARREVTMIVRMLLERDEEAGRPDITDYVERMLFDGDEQSLYMDRVRK